ncbi:hypothetical protein ABT282_08200 [Streptomyces sp. NPDC000927]|uniref:hypothetical protein n=1 Tax=Streptomyces sp. NPDC000927 TaxID=3154371 RepID=UPI0033182D4A
MGALDKIKKAVAPPVTAAWIDMLVTGMDARAQEIEGKKGAEAADAFREKKGRSIARITKRGIIG